MPFITTEEVKEIRNAVKKAFPEFKFSVRKSDHSGVTITVVHGPLAFNNEFAERQCQVNPYWYASHHEDNPEFVEFMEKLIAVVDGVKQKCESSYDCDYGSIPNYYRNFNIGRWDKPYVLKAKKTNEPKKVQPSYEECFMFAFVN